ncbi:MAG: hypothetical protein RL026_2741 [Pseudomonadota bacterium]|jgi:phage shock protein PspC (stress-responsive transcriptional regulator)
MEKVITINLNNNAYAVEETGFETLSAYLRTAAERLADNPDRQEIITDLEQAIADRCRATLRPHKTVVTAAEIDTILAEMGPVDGGDATEAATRTAADGTGAATDGAATAAPKRLYRLWDQKLLSGVCTGLGAYFGIDVVWVRIAFVLLTLFTSGLWILFYLALALIIPRANTAAEVAAAHGAPFSARDLIERVKKKHEGGGPGLKTAAPLSGALNPAWRQPGYGSRVAAGVALPLLTVASAALFAGWLVAVALAGSGQIPPGVHIEGIALPPAWLVVVVVCAGYALLAWPLRTAQRAALHQINGGHWFGWANLLTGLLWLVVAAVVLGVAAAECDALQPLLRDLSRMDQTYRTATIS